MRFYIAQVLSVLLLEKDKVSHHIEGVQMEMDHSQLTLVLIR